VLSDTVGFIADLPVELIAAFRATLEEVLEADIILHVRDVAHEESEAQKGDVLKVLSELDIDTEGDRRILEVLNKIDLLSPAARKGLRTRNGNESRTPIAISALTAEGLVELLNRMDHMLERQAVTLMLRVPPSDGAGIAWAYAHGRVLTRNERKGVTELTVSINPEALGRFQNRYGKNLKSKPSP
jgi:GTP-binding protein HflX